MSSTIQYTNYWNNVNNQVNQVVDQSSNLNNRYPAPSPVQLQAATTTQPAPTPTTTPQPQPPQASTPTPTVTQSHPPTSQMNGTTNPVTMSDQMSLMYPSLSNSNSNSSLEMRPSTPSHKEDSHETASKKGHVSEAKSPGACSNLSFHEDENTMSSPNSTMAASPKAAANMNNSAMSQAANSSQHSTDIFGKLMELGAEPERRLFVDNLQIIFDEYAIQSRNLPNLSKQPLDLFKLYMAVKEKGGFNEVSRLKLWKDVITLMHIGPSPTAAFNLKKKFVQLGLFHYECKFDRNGIDPLPLLADFNEKPVKTPKTPKNNNGEKEKSSKKGSKSNNAAASTPSSGATTNTTNTAATSAPPNSTAAANNNQPPVSVSGQPAPHFDQQQQHNNMYQPYNPNHVNPNMGNMHPNMSQYPPQNMTQPGMNSQYGNSAPNSYYGAQMAHHNPSGAMIQQLKQPPLNYAPFNQMPPYGNQQPSSVPQQPPQPQSQPQNVYPGQPGQPQPQAPPPGHMRPPNAQYAPPNDTNYPYGSMRYGTAPVPPPPTHPQVNSNQPHSNMHYAANGPTQPVPPAQASHHTDPNHQAAYHPNQMSHVTQPKPPFPMSTPPVAPQTPGAHMNHSNMLNHGPAMMNGSANPIPPSNTNAVFAPSPSTPSRAMKHKAPPATVNQPAYTNGNHFMPAQHPMHPHPAHHNAPHQPNKPKEHVFPPDSVEATQVTESKRRKLTHKDVTPCDPWKLFMCLKSGLLAESAWALDALNIFLYDDNTVAYFHLKNFPGLLNILLEHFIKCLQLIFAHDFDDLIVGECLMVDEDERSQVGLDKVKGGDVSAAKACVAQAMNTLRTQKVLQVQLSEKELKRFYNPHKISKISDKNLTAANTQLNRLNLSILSQIVNNNNSNNKMDLGENETNISEVETKKRRAFNYIQSHMNSGEVRPSEASDDTANVSREDDEDALQQALDADEENVFKLVSQSQDELMRRCICISTIMRNLSFIPGNESELCKNGVLVKLHARLLTYKHAHVHTNIASTESDGDAGALATRKIVNEAPWWLECVQHLRENTLVCLSNVAAVLNLNNYEESVIKQITNGLMHWSICKTPEALDCFVTLPDTSVISAQRLAIETLSKMTITEINIDFVLATANQRQLESFFESLSDWLAKRDDETLKEFSIVLLTSIAKCDAFASKLIVKYCSLLIRFLEDFEEQSKQLHHTQYAAMHHMSNEEMLGTSVDMLRRCANCLLSLALVPDNVDKILKYEDRILDLITSQFIDYNVTQKLAEVLYYCSNPNIYASQSSTVNANPNSAKSSSSSAQLTV